MDTNLSTRSSGPRHGTWNSMSLMAEGPAQEQQRKVSTVSTEDFVVVQPGHRRPASGPSLGYATLESPWPMGQVQWDLAETGYDRDTKSEADAGPEQQQQLAAVEQAENIEQLGDAAQSISQQQARGAKLREQAMMFRNEVSYQRKELQRQQKIVIDKIHVVVRELQSFLGEASVSEQIAHIKANLQPLEESYKDLSEKAAKLEELEDALSSVEYRMQEEETELARVTLNAIPIIRDLGWGLPFAEQVAAGREALQSIHADTLGPPVNPLLQEFYDRFGDARVLAGRLAEFEGDYNDAKTRFVHDEEHDRAVESTLDEFEAKWDRERAWHKRAISLAVEAVEFARNACLEAGLEPEGYKRELSDYTSMYQDPIEEAQQEDGSHAIAAQQNQEDVLAAIHTQKMYKEDPSAVRVAYRKSELIDPDNPFHRPEDVQGLAPFAVEHLAGDTGLDSPLSASMSLSHDRIEMWRQDIPGDPDRSTAASIANDGMRSQTRANSIETDPHRATSLKSMPLVSSRKFAHVFTSLVWRTRSGSLSLKRHIPRRLVRNSTASMERMQHIQGMTSDTALSQLQTAEKVPYPEALDDMRSTGAASISYPVAGQHRDIQESSGSARRQVAGD